MILIPYFIDTSKDWIQLGLFLCSGGREVWSVDGTDKQVAKMLATNGFPVLTMDKQSDALYAKIDLTKLQMVDFYTWDEVDPKTSEEDCWRIFNIPKALWSCPVFKEHYWKAANLPFTMTTSSLLSSSL